MKQRLYGGFDESYVSKRLDVYVLALSEDYEDIEVDNSLPSKSGRNRRNCTEILGDRDFRYIILGREFLSRFSVPQRRAIALYEFLENVPNLSNIYIDGTMLPDSVNSLDQLIEDKPSFTYVPKGEDYIKLVNIADQIAYSLNHVLENRHDKCTRGLEELTQSREITVDFDFYKANLKKINKHKKNQKKKKTKKKTKHHKRH